MENKLKSNSELQVLIEEKKDLLEALKELLSKKTK
jgi:hypothetical protein